jgi:DNA invertase Pin-like site-specific DNA recombinase
VLHLYAALAEKEGRLISQRTKDALAALKAQGEKLGGTRPKSAVARDEAKARAEALRATLVPMLGMSSRVIAQRLTEQGVGATRGGAWSQKLCCGCWRGSG